LRVCQSKNEENFIEETVWQREPKEERKRKKEKYKILGW
jgi:hypothetical protein